MRLQKQAILQKQKTVVTNIATNMMTTYTILHSNKKKLYNNYTFTIQIIVYNQYPINNNNNNSILI